MLPSKPRIIQFLTGADFRLADRILSPTHIMNHNRKYLLDETKTAQLCNLLLGPDLRSKLLYCNQPPVWSTIWSV